jgi:drug/metabolite transporter (DMT)-like permease
MQFLGILMAISAAFAWGGADFSGGYATRRNNQFQIVFLNSLIGLALLVLLALLWGESLPVWHNTLIALAAGLCGAFAMPALYKGLSIGNVALVSPVAAVVGAIIPMSVGMLIEGLPSVAQRVGFILALAGIWLVSRYSADDGDNGANAGLGLALLAGLGFGGYLSLIPQIKGEGVFTPLAITKLVAMLVALALMRRNRLALPAAGGAALALLSGVLDVGGNFLYLFGTRFARLDIVAALAALYPAGTVLLSSLLLKERFARTQLLGMVVCLAAILLITV